MFDFHERRKMRNIVYSKPILVILAVASVMLLYSVWGASQKESDTRLKKNQRASVLSEFHEREETLRVEIERLNTKRGIEAEIRSKFEVAKKGEKVIVIVEPPEEDDAQLDTENKGFFRRLFNF